MSKATLVNAEGLEEYGLKTGDTGEVTGRKRIMGQDIVFFRPDDTMQIYAISHHRVEDSE
tara:strand:- start:25550 stop:25729 length:180 start_codon:yes stop_codon:yes gene_type:complete